METFYPDYQKSLPIPSERYNEVIFIFSPPTAWKSTIERYKDWLIYSEDETTIVFITKEREEWVTDLEVEVYDFRTQTVFKNKVAIQSVSEKYWDNRIKYIQENRELSRKKIESL